MQTPDLDQLPAAEAHCLTMRRRSDVSSPEVLNDTHPPSWDNRTTGGTLYKITGKLSGDKHPDTLANEPSWDDKSTGPLYKVTPKFGGKHKAEKLCKNNGEEQSGSNDTLLSTPSWEGKLVFPFDSNDETWDKKQSKSSGKSSWDKKQLPLLGPGQKSDGLLKSSSFKHSKRPGSFKKRDKNNKDSDGKFAVRWKGLSESDRVSKRSPRSKLRKTSFIGDGMLSFVAPLASPVAPHLATSASETTLCLSNDDYFDDTSDQHRLPRVKKHSGNLAQVMKRNPDHGLPYLKRLADNASLPASPTLMRRTKQTLSIRSSPVRLFSDRESSATPPVSPTLKKLPDSVPCSPNRSKPKFSLSGSPSNSSRGSPPISPFAPHAPITSPRSRLDRKHHRYDDSSSYRDYLYSPQSSPDILCKSSEFHPHQPQLRFLCVFFSQRTRK